MSSFNPEKFTILIVDDTVENVELLVEVLHEVGYNTSFSHSGQQALIELKKVVVDLIIMDLMMPGLNGVETSQLIKKNTEWENIPIIFLSAYPDLDSLNVNFQTGKVDFLQKPFSLKELLKRIEHTLT